MMSEDRVFDIMEVAGKLIGPTSFTGEHQTDVDRIDNICQAGKLARHYVQELRDLAQLKDDNRHSANRMGKTAQFWLDEIKEYM